MIVRGIAIAFLLLGIFFFLVGVCFCLVIFDLILFLNFLNPPKVLVFLSQNISFSVKSCVIVWDDEIILVLRFIRLLSNIFQATFSCVTGAYITM